MFYKRPSLRRGGMPTGIDTLSPRVQAKSGFFGQTPLFFRDSKQIGLDFPSTITSMQMPTAFQEKNDEKLSYGCIRNGCSICC